MNLQKLRRYLRNFQKCLPNLNSKRLAIVTILVIFLWFVLIVIRWSQSSRIVDDDIQIKTEIIDLSLKYIKTLSRKHQNTIDGRYNGQNTAYDLKKTLAVLLQNLMERITVIESRLNINSSDTGVRINRQNSGSNQSISPFNRHINTKVDYIDLLKGSQEECEMNFKDKLNYPQCDEKIAWMKKHWKSHKCYADNNVDGTECSIILYLSEVERHCPVIKSRESLVKQNISAQFYVPADINTNISQLWDRLEQHMPTNTASLTFIKTRIASYWTQMTAAAISLNNSVVTFNYIINKPTGAASLHRLQQSGPRGGGGHVFHRYQKNIIVYMGFLSKSSKLNLSSTLLKGGPLGELVQWTDLISSLFILGHEVTIFSELADIQKYLSQRPNLNVPCQSKYGLMIDLIFTDLIGYNQVSSKLSNFKCLLRILDTFGTRPAFNNNLYFKQNKIKKNTWMGKMLELKQFYTMFPHTSDNTFLGFVVNKPPLPLIWPRKPRALLYAKHRSIWQQHLSTSQLTDLLATLHSYFEIHATIESENSLPAGLPKYVINHGFLLGSKYSQLLSTMMVFVGLGFPYEGPAPLEAIARGVVFLNVQFNTEQKHLTQKFFQSKPTDRMLEYQHPYIAETIQPPYAYNIRLENMTLVHEVISRVLSNLPTSGYIPYEFTEAGMLERLNVLVSRQQFCSSSGLLASGGIITNDAEWPPLNSAHFFMGLANESCDTTCEQKGMRCQSSFTELVVNQRLELQARGVWCDNVRYDAGLTSPHYNVRTRTCHFQTDHLMFSCSNSAPDHMRFCGCMVTHKRHPSLCADCL